MDIKRKLDIAYRAIESISQHTDADSQLLHHALDRLVEKVKDEKTKVDAFVKSKLDDFHKTAPPDRETIELADGARLEDVLPAGEQ